MDAVPDFSLIIFSSGEMARRPSVSTQRAVLTSSPPEIYAATAPGCKERDEISSDEEGRPACPEPSHDPGRRCASHRPGLLLQARWNPPCGGGASASLHIHQPVPPRCHRYWPSRSAE